MLVRNTVSCKIRVESTPEGENVYLSTAVYICISPLPFVVLSGHETINQLHAALQEIQDSEIHF